MRGAKRKKIGIGMDREVKYVEKQETFRDKMKSKKRRHTHTYQTDRERSTDRKRNMPRKEAERNS
jgi:hypothetical protein